MYLFGLQEDGPITGGIYKQGGGGGGTVYGSNPLKVSETPQLVDDET